MKKHNHTEAYCYELTTCLIDEAIAIYKGTNKLSPDFGVCRCSVKRAFYSLKHHLETGEHLGFVKISFRDQTEFTMVYVNVEFVKNQLNK